MHGCKPAASYIHYTPKHHTPQSRGPLTLSLDAASRMSGCRSNPNRVAKRTARSTRSGSSRKVSDAGRGVRSSPALRSESPLPVRSSTAPSFRL